MEKKTFRLLPNYVKYVGEDDQFYRLKVLLIAYGSSNHRDLGGDYFTSETDFGDKYVKTLKAYYDHDATDNPYMPEDARLIGRATFVEEDNLGRWYLFELDKANRYNEYILKLAQKGYLGASTQAYPASVVRHEDGFISRWHESEATLTVMPMNPDTRGKIYAYKYLSDLLTTSKKQLKARYIKDIDLSVTDGMVVAARRGLEWRREYGRGGTRVGVETARQIITNRRLTPERWIRMYSFFSRHEVDKQAEGFNAGEAGFPSNGRIAWDLWGGDAGYSRSTLIRNQLQNSEE